MKVLAEAILATTSSSEEASTADAVLGALFSLAIGVYFVKYRRGKRKRDAQAEEDQKVLLTSAPTLQVSAGQNSEAPRGWYPDPAQSGRLRLWTGGSWGTQLTFTSDTPLPHSTADQPITEATPAIRRGTMSQALIDANQPKTELSGPAADFAKWWSGPAPVQVPRLPQIERGPLVVAAVFTLVWDAIQLSTNEVRYQGGWFVTILVIISFAVVQFALILVIATYLGRYWRLSLKATVWVVIAAVAIVVAAGLLVALYYVVIFIVVMIFIGAFVGLARSLFP